MLEKTTELSISIKATMVGFVITPMVLKLGNYIYTQV